MLAILCLLLAAAFQPGRENVLILGVDSREPGSNLGRTDTMVLATFVPIQPYVGMLSIPRDLWVSIPGENENRVNTAHFFAEAAIPGSGPAAAMETVRQNFGVDVDYYILVRFEGFKEVIDALGGLDVELAEAVGEFEAGKHHLNGEDALALVRSRAGSDDFSRMEHGQLLLKAVMRRMLNPLVWPRLPAVASALGDAVDTDLPAWKLPTLAITLLRMGVDGIDGRTITREMTTPFTTPGGAAVLLPRWELINPVLLEMFGQ